MEVKRFYLRFVTGLVCLLGIFHKGSGFGPRKLYSLSFDRNIASVKVSKTHYSEFVYRCNIGIGLINFTN